MYNRYLPNADGSFRRQSIPNPAPADVPPQKHPDKHPPAAKQKKPPAPGLDTGELLILLILLLLLESGGEDELTILLAAGIYLFTK